MSVAGVKRGRTDEDFFTCYQKHHQLGEKIVELERSISKLDAYWDTKAAEIGVRFTQYGIRMTFINTRKELYEELCLAKELQAALWETIMRPCS